MNVSFISMGREGMAKIKVKGLEVGMTLTADVCDPNGRFLLGEGCVLSEKHLKALHAWGVISVEISDDEMPESKLDSKLSPEYYKKLEEQVAKRFIHNNMSLPFIEELATESVRFLAEQLGE